MFDLEQAIANWRRELAASGLGSSEVIDELESHLRDDLEEQAEQARGNSDEERVFRMAVQRIGQAAVLEAEFHKVGGIKRVQERLKVAFLTLAGIPNHHSPLMNTSQSNLEPCWATYLKAAAFLVPAGFLWMLAAFFVVPKLQQICAQAGMPAQMPLWNLTLSNFNAILFFKEHIVLIGAAIISVLVLLERRSVQWPRYRRAVVGVGAFLFNSLVLVSIFVMILTAIVAAPGLFQHTP
jgi:hypothetical protein